MLYENLPKCTSRQWIGILFNRYSMISSACHKIPGFAGFPLFHGTFGFLAFHELLLLQGC